jgi:O-antigen ligase
LALGVAQLASPNGGSAYPYAYTNLGSVVGWFANHNHEAAFLLALMPLSAALVTMWRRSPHAQGTAAWPIGLFAAISIVALGVINSRAGIVLAGPAMFAALAVLALGARGRRGASLWIAATVFAGLAILAVVAFGLNPILDRFGGPKVTEVRFEAWPIIADAALAHQPLGAGLGAFELVFQSVEPLGFVGVTFLNHAHNDYLELWLETGWLGLAIFILFAAWLIRAQLIAWRRGKGLARGAGAAILLILAASAVDYPLRTETILVFFAFCCGVLAVETQAAEPRRR